MLQPSFATLAFILALSTATPVWADACNVNSGPGRAALLELYTSEGCSSCPPADRWLSRLPTQGYSPQRVVPLALHVDYWDYIGWQDRFAKPAFTARQRVQAASGFVYTPQVMLNGQDFRGWGSAGRFEAAVAAINRTVPLADIRLTLTQPAADRLEVAVTAQAPAQPNAALYLALYENGLATQVKAGENSGATLQHDFVVREWLGPYAIDKPVQQKLVLKPGWKTKDLGIAAFVQSRGNGEILQALASKLCE